MQKEDLSIDITFNHCYFSLDSPFKAMRSFVSLKNVQRDKLDKKPQI
jgi:hypothetical protein